MKAPFFQRVDGELLFMVALVLITLIGCVANIVEDYKHRQEERENQKQAQICPLCGGKGAQ